MELREIYDWLITTNPNGSTIVRMAWANMASYCYFVNVMDFDTTYREQLTEVLKKSDEFGIVIPNSNHSKIMEIGKNAKIQIDNEQ